MGQTLRNGRAGPSNGPRFEYQYSLRKMSVVGFYNICNRNNIQGRFLEKLQEKSLKRNSSENTVIQ